VLFFKKKKKDITKNPFYDKGSTLVVYFKCSKCGELFRSHLRKYYDVSVNYGGAGVKELISLTRSSLEAIVRIKYKFTPNLQEASSHCPLI